jgi:hypothetical protein
MIGSLARVSRSGMLRLVRRHAVHGTLALIGVSGMGYRMTGSHMSAEAASLPQGILSDINGPKRAAMKAADNENARLAEQTGQAVPARRDPAATNGARAPMSGPGSAPAGAASSAPSAARSVSGDGAKPQAPVTREVYGYARDGRRDPFFSLILTEDLRPLLSELKLVGILYDASGHRSVAIMRDLQTNAQYRVNAGTTLGRMRVAQIKPRAVIFSIDEFGLSRQDSLTLSDSTKVRIR